MTPFADIAQTTPTSNAIAAAVNQGYALGEVLECELLRRGFNHVYGLRFIDGRRVVARLCANRPRGAPNGYARTSPLSRNDWTSVLQQCRS